MVKRLADWTFAAGTASFMIGVLFVYVALFLLGFEGGIGLTAMVVPWFAFTGTLLWFVAAALEFWRVRP